MARLTVVYGAKVALHSSHYGNYHRRTPAQRLATLLASMKDEERAA